MVQLDIHEAGWIKEQTVVYGATSSNVLLGNCIPVNFESYCKLYHPFVLLPDQPDHLVPDKEKEKPGDIHINLQAGKITVGGKDLAQVQLARQRQKEEGTPVSWRSVGERYGISFHKGTSADDYTRKFKETGWPNNLLLPDEGRMPIAVLSVLLDILTRFSGKKQVRIYQMPPNAIYRGGNQPMELVEATYDEVLAYFTEYFIGYLFPADRSWIVFTDTDLPYTLVGGPARLIDQMLESPLEVLKCNASTVISHKE